MSKRVPPDWRILRGNPSRRPIPPQMRPKMLEAMPDPPDVVSASEDARNAWFDVGSELCDVGVMSTLDLSTFGVFCISYARWLACERAMAASGLTIEGRGGPVRNPLLRITAQAASDAVKLASEFGLSPSARLNVAVGGLPPTRDRLDDLLA